MKAQSLKSECVDGGRMEMMHTGVTAKPKLLKKKKKTCSGRPEFNVFMTVVFAVTPVGCDVTMSDGAA